MELKADPFLSLPRLEELMLKTDLGFFAEEMLGIEISDHHTEWSTLVARHPRLAIEAPRDHGKSFFFSFAYAIWRSYYAWIPPILYSGFKSIPKISMGYIFSNTQDQAIKFLEIIRNELEMNPKLQHLVPEKKDNNWNKTEMRLSNRAVLRARGWGTSVRGAHPCWAICDDVLNDESIYSEITRKKQVDYFFSAVTPMIVPGGQIVVIGTPFHGEDLYQKLSENKSYVFKKYPALDAYDRPLWPTRYTKEHLHSKRDEVGSTRFAREYLCEPVSDESSLFPEKIIADCYDFQYEMPTHLTPEDRKNLMVFTGVDLALSSTVGADYTVITTLGVDKFKNRWLLDIRRKKGLSMTEQLREIEDVYVNYRPLKVLIEDNGFQRVFRDELVKNTDIPVEGFTTTAQNKNSLEKGVPSLQILFENKKFVIPRKTERDRRITDFLINELKCFTWQDGKLQGLGAHDDCVMSLWIASEACSAYQFSFSFV